MARQSIHVSRQYLIDQIEAKLAGYPARYSEEAGRLNAAMTSYRERLLDGLRAAYQRVAEGSTIEENWHDDRIWVQIEGLGRFPKSQLPTLQFEEAALKKDLALIKASVDDNFRISAESDWAVYVG